MKLLNYSYGWLAIKLHLQPEHIIRLTVVTWPNNFIEQTKKFPFSREFFYAYFRATRLRLSMTEIQIKAPKNAIKAPTTSGEV